MIKQEKYYLFYDNLSEHNPTPHHWYWKNNHAIVLFQNLVSKQGGDPSRFGLLRVTEISEIPVQYDALVSSQGKPHWVPLVKAQSNTSLPYRFVTKIWRRDPEVKMNLSGGGTEYVPIDTEERQLFQRMRQENIHMAIAYALEQNDAKAEGLLRALN